jgi:diadenosine tetraphosphate (Ap4A) HIT family hydrolase
MSETLIHRGVAQARAGTNPTVIARLRSGWAVAGLTQVVDGYCLLLPDPVVPDLNALIGSARTQFLLDMVALGDVLLELTGALRINYEILGNLEPALHAHLFPRYASEPDGLRQGPIWHYDWNAAPPFDAAKQAPFMARVRATLTARGLTV